MAENSKGYKSKCRRTHDEMAEEEIDRLADLPDDIMLRVLSFLDTKSAFQASLVSKRWRSLWKDVTVLHFSRESFPCISSFTKHVEGFLSHRSKSAAVGSIAIDFPWECDGYSGTRLLDIIMKYADGGDGGELHHLSISGYDVFKLDWIAASIVLHRHHQSLRTLKLEGTNLESCSGFALGFKLLETMELRDCHLSPGDDPFANLPCLNCLKILECRATSLLKISGDQLLDLEITSLDCRSGGYEVVAPKLKSFRFRGHLAELVKLSIPALDYANVNLLWEIHGKTDYYTSMTTGKMNRAYMKLLSQLHNAESLRLRFEKLQGTLWGEHQFPLNSMDSSVQAAETSPFIRLKTVRVQYPQEPPSKAYQAIRYLLQGNPNTEGNYIKFEKRIDKITPYDVTCYGNFL